VDMRRLQQDLRGGRTDVQPAGRDATAVTAWTNRTPVPALSRQFQEDRSILIVPISRASIGSYAAEFDSVVEDIEKSVRSETAGVGITAAWATRPSGGAYNAPEPETCTACDHKHYCPLARAVGYGTPPTAP